MKEYSSCLETDFILSIDTTYGKTSGDSESWLEVHPVFENQAAMMLALPPRVLLPQNSVSTDGEIVFVADRSGSMEDKMANLKSATKFFLKGIPIGRTFNIWCFGSNHQPLWTKSQVYGKESLQLALDHVDANFRADMGGTELFSVLESIVATRDPSLPCDVVILTDGEVWRLDEILGLVRRANESSKGGIRFFSLGLGNHVSHALIEGIAKQGGGYSEVIPQANKEGWEERAIAMLQAALTNHIHNIKLDLGGLRAATSPGNLKYLNPFEQNHIFLLLEKNQVLETEGITLTLISDGRDIPVDVSITRLGKPGTLIHHLSARAILDDVEQALRLHTPYQYGGRSETELSRLAESLACKYSLLSQWTSLFLMREKTELSGSEIPPQSFPVIKTSRGGDSFLQNRGLNSSELGLLEPEGPRPLHIIQQAFTCEFSSELLPPSPDPRPIFLSQAALNLLGMIPQSRTGVGFISIVLDCQAFDGSIENGTIDELPEEARDAIYSLKTWLREKTNISGVTLDLVSNTALIVAILERDYQVDKQLWIRIHEKALEYIGLQIAQPDLKDGLMEYAREMLSRLGGPVSLKRKVSINLMSPGGPVRETYKIANSESPARSNRVLVDKAPID
ncbi:hypothetical protein NUW58_g52 [Xylaria curta]|uniref:Uncharacterized protein n=1 Tax=Xylaria curta TaxID=42375 RepID=A0ACC1PR41_9PEZI|nr:hypothetical protein NUW58_g52 [Xylaria curta]